MAAHNELGKCGEEFAKQYLLGKGYRIIETNWRCEHLEIDIIAQKFDFLSIIEVKTRSNNNSGYPEEAVTVPKMRKLLKAAEKYMQLNNFTNGVRFEVLALTKSGESFDVEHFEEAFTSVTAYSHSTRW